MSDIIVATIIGKTHCSLVKSIENNNKKKYINNNNKHLFVNNIE